MIAAFLIRCSTNRQDYDRQLKDLTEIATKKNFEVKKEFIFGEHITGKDDTTKGDRQSIRKLFSAVDKKQFDVLLINEVSRMSRDGVSGRIYVRKLNNAGIPTYFRDRNRWTIDLDTKEVDTAFEKELGTYFDGAAEYLKSLKTQTASGRRNKLMSGQMTQGVAFGYMKKGGYDKETKNTVFIKEEEADIVKFIYNKYLADGATLKSTALATSGTYNKKFSVGKINHILNYAGYYLGYTIVTTTDPDYKEQNTFKISIGKIIDEELYKAVQKKLKENRSSAKLKNNAQKVRILSKLIKCSFCGHSFTPAERTDGRPVYTWKCMSRINNSSDCDSHINLNDQKMVALIWELIKKELISFNDYNEEERKSKIEEQDNKIKDYQRDIIVLNTNKNAEQKKIERAYSAYLSAPAGTEIIALDLYNKTLKTCKGEIDDINSGIDSLRDQITFCENRIDRFSRVNFSEEYIKEIEADDEKKREVFLQYILAIYPYKVSYRILVVEVVTVDGLFYILFDGNQRKYQVATYIRSEFAVWQNSNKKVDLYSAGDYFLVPNASMVMDTDELEEFLNFKQMNKVCMQNGWELDYSNYPNNIYKKKFISNIERYNKKK